MLSGPSRLSSPRGDHSTFGGPQAQREPYPTPRCSARSRSSPARCRSPGDAELPPWAEERPGQPSPAQPACRTPSTAPSPGAARPGCSAGGSQRHGRPRGTAPVFRKRFPAAICRNRSDFFLLFSSLRRPCRPFSAARGPGPVSLAGVCRLRCARRCAEEGAKLGRPEPCGSQG